MNMPWAHGMTLGAGQKRRMPDGRARLSTAGDPAGQTKEGLLEDGVESFDYVVLMSWKLEQT
jgi:hypothetical protein